MCPPNSQPALTVTGKPAELKDVAKRWQKNGKNIGLYRRERKGSDPNKSRITVADVAVAAVIAIRTIFTAPNAIIMSARVPSTAGKTTIRPILVPSAKVPNTPLRKPSGRSTTAILAREARSYRRASESPATLPCPGRYLFCISDK